VYQLQAAASGAPIMPDLHATVTVICMTVQLNHQLMQSQKELREMTGRANSLRMKNEQHEEEVQRLKRDRETLKQQLDEQNGQTTGKNEEADRSPPNKKRNLQKDDK
jgi:TolA-binding protein